jgi:hypothetical protein
VLFKRYIQDGGGLYLLQTDISKITKVCFTSNIHQSSTSIQLIQIDSTRICMLSQQQSSAYSPNLLQHCHSGGGHHGGASIPQGESSFSPTLIIVTLLSCNVQLQHNQTTNSSFQKNHGCFKEKYWRSQNHGGSKRELQRGWQLPATVSFLSRGLVTGCSSQNGRQGFVS